MSSDIERRKADHLELCASDAVAFRGKTTLLECVGLVHQSLPDLAIDDIDTSVELFGKKLKAPLIVAGMTGGTERAGEVNRALAACAERRGYGFGLGSQRAMQRNPNLASSYQVRDVAPTALLFGNIGVMQARDLDTLAVRELAHAVGADALCVHMNPAMELVQPGGDRDFRGGAETMARLAVELGLPVIAKETGNGVSFQTASKLREAGVRTIDVSGAGGTSWVGVETLRAEGKSRALGEVFWDWGIPTAASIVFACRAGAQVIGTGGIQNGLDVARAIVLGATSAGIARPALQAYTQAGADGVDAFFDQIEAELRTVMLLCGARTIADLRAVPRMIHGTLREWCALT